MCDFRPMYDNDEENTSIEIQFQRAFSTVVNELKSSLCDLIKETEKVTHDFIKLAEIMRDQKEGVDCEEDSYEPVTKDTLLPRLRRIK